MRKKETGNLLSKKVVNRFSRVINRFSRENRGLFALSRENRGLFAFSRENRGLFNHLTAGSA